MERPIQPEAGEGTLEVPGEDSDPSPPPFSWQLWTATCGHPERVLFLPESKVKLQSVAGGQGAQGIEEEKA